MKIKELIKNYIKIVILISGILLATDFDKLFKIATLENSYQNKVEFAVARTVDADLFDLQVSVTLVDNADYAEYLTIQSQSNIEEPTDNVTNDEAESTTELSPGFLPGLPSIPTSAVDEKGLAVDTKISQDDDNNFNEFLTFNVKFSRKK